MGPSGRFTHVMIYWTVWDRYMQVLFLGRAPRTKETLPDFREKCRVTRHSRVFRGLTGSQRTPGFWGVTVSKAYPVCNEHTKSQRLRNKICYMGHRRYLDGEHSWRKSKQYDGKPEYGSPPNFFTGNDILHQLQDVHCGKFERIIIT